MLEWMGFLSEYIWRLTHYLVGVDVDGMLKLPDILSGPRDILWEIPVLSMISVES
jgi:hypothetical protein